MASLSDLPEERQLNILRSIVLCDLGEKESLREEVKSLLKENERLMKKVILYERVTQDSYACKFCDSLVVSTLSKIRHKCGLLKSSTMTVFHCEECKYEVKICPYCNTTNFEVVESVDFEK